MNNSTELDPNDRLFHSGVYAKHEHLAAAKRDAAFDEAMSSFIGRSAARRANLIATANYNSHNAEVERSYAAGTRFNTSAVDQALIEQKNRDAGKDFGRKVNDQKIDFNRLVSKYSKDSSSLFENIDSIREHAADFVSDSDKFFVAKNGDSTIIHCSSYYGRYFNYAECGGWGRDTIAEYPIGLKLSIDKGESLDNKQISIELFEFADFKNGHGYYLPKSETILREDNTAVQRTYDWRTAEYLPDWHDLSAGSLDELYSGILEAKFGGDDRTI